MKSTAYSCDVRLNEFLDSLGSASIGVAPRQAPNTARKANLGSRSDFSLKKTGSRFLEPIAVADLHTVENHPKESTADSGSLVNERRSAGSQAIGQIVISAGIANATMIIAISLGLLSITPAVCYALGHVIASGISIRCIRTISFS